MDLSEVFSYVKIDGTSIFANPLKMAAITIGIMIIIVWFVLRDDIRLDQGASMGTILARIGVWGGIVSVVSFLLYDKAVNDLYDKKYKDEAKERIFERVTNGTFENTPIAAIPSFNKS